MMYMFDFEIYNLLNQSKYMYIISRKNKFILFGRHIIKTHMGDACLELLMATITNKLVGFVHGFVYQN